MTNSGNAAQYFVDRHVAEGRADNPAFREAFGDRRELSFGALAQQSGCVATALGRAGITREARALMLVLDQIEFPEIFWGCLKAGVIPVPLNTMLPATVYRAILNDTTWSATQRMSMT